jgi:hypothetical protein
MAKEKKKREKEIDSYTYSRKDRIVRLKIKEKQSISD